MRCPPPGLSHNRQGTVPDRIGSDRISFHPLIYTPTSASTFRPTASARIYNTNQKSAKFRSLNTAVAVKLRLPSAEESWGMLAPPGGRGGRGALPACLPACNEADDLELSLVGGSGWI